MDDVALREQITGFATAHPKLAATYRRLVASRTIIFMSIISVICIYDLWFDSYEPLDPILYFGPAGSRLLSSDWANTFQDAGVQIGPALVAIFGLGHLLEAATGLNIHLIVSPFTQILLLLGSLKVVELFRSGSGLKFPPGLRLFTGLSVLMGGIAWETSASAHPAESLNALCWLGAAFYAKKGSGTRAAVLIAASATLKPWGLLGLPILLLNPRLSRSITSGTAAVLMSASVYAPFVLFGEMRMFDLEWQVKAHSPLALFLPWNSSFGWDMRLLQGGITLIIPSMLVLLRRKSSVPIWSAPLQVCLVRLAIDPLGFHYYWMTPALIIVLGLISELPAAPTWRRVPIPIVFYALVWPFFYLRGTLLAVVTLLMIAVMLTGSLQRARPAYSVAAA